MTADRRSAKPESRKRRARKRRDRTERAAPQTPPGPPQSGTLPTAPTPPQELHQAIRAPRSPYASQRGRVKVLQAAVIAVACLFFFEISVLAAIRCLLIQDFGDFLAVFWGWFRMAALILVAGGVCHLLLSGVRATFETRDGTLETLAFLRGWALRARAAEEGDEDAGDEGEATEDHTAPEDDLGERTRDDPEEDEKLSPPGSEA